MKRRHVSYTNELKIEAILGNKKGITPTELSRRLQVPRSTLCHWIRHEKELEEYVNRLLQQHERAPRMPECLHDYYLELVKAGGCPADADLLHHARGFARLFNEAELIPDNVWLKAWRRQFNVDEVSNHLSDSGIESESPRAESGEKLVLPDPVAWAKRWLASKNALEGIPNFDDLSIRTKKSRAIRRDLAQHNNNNNNSNNEELFQTGTNGEQDTLDHGEARSSLSGHTGRRKCDSNYGRNDGTVKRKYVSYTMEEKQKTIRCIRAGVSQSAVSKVVQVPRTTLRNWIENESSIAQFVRNFGSADNALHRKRCKAALNPQLDKCVFDYWESRRRQGVILSDACVQRRAQLFSRLLGCSEDQKHSLGWLERWKIRHGVRSLKTAHDQLNELALPDDQAISSDCVAKSRALSKCLTGEATVAEAAAEFSLDPLQLARLVSEESDEEAEKWLERWLEEERSGERSENADDSNDRPSPGKTALMLNDELFISIMCMDPDSWSMRKGIEVFAEAQALISELNRDVVIADKESEVADLVRDLLELKSKLIERNAENEQNVRLHRNNHLPVSQVSLATDLSFDDNASEVSLPPLQPLEFTRFDSLDHWADFQESEQTCQFCRLGRSAVHCTKCKVPLCLRKGKNCFRLFHTETPDSDA